MSAIRHYANQEPRRESDEGTAERALMLWIALYSALVIVLIGNHLYGRGLPLLDSYGRLAVMTPTQTLPAIDGTVGDPTLARFVEPVR